MTLIILICLAGFLLLSVPQWVGDQYPASGSSGSTTTAGLDQLSKQTTLTSASTAYVLDSLLVRSYASGEWRLDLTKGTAKRSVTVRIWHDGSLSSAATTALWTVEGGGPQGTVDVAISATLTGSGATQAFNLVATASSTGWTAATWRIPLVKVPQ